MASSFVGLYLCPPKQAQPERIQVRDGEGSEKSLSRQDYEAHAVQPPWQSLPWQGEPSPVPDESAKHGPEFSM